MWNPSKTNRRSKLLGQINHFRCCIPRYDASASPLTTCWPWIDSLVTRLRRICHGCEACSLDRNDLAFAEHGTYHVYSYASVRGIGGTLLQYFSDGLQAVAFCGKRKTSAKVSYITTEQELLAMV